MNPILSICIPTLNRCGLLEILLENLEREATVFLDRIEIVVADNASKDGTPEVVKRSPLPIVYGRQNSTVGFARNVLFAAAELASGDFIWVIGDDDLVLSGGVARVLQSLDDAPDVDYHYLNFGWIDHKLRQRVIREWDGRLPPSAQERWQCTAPGWKRLDRLENLVFLPSGNPSALFSGVFCFVTRKQFYAEATGTLQPTDSLDGSSTAIADCFPHAMLSLPNVVGKPIAYVGDPCVMQGISGWEWKDYAYKNMIFGTHQFFEWLEKTGFSADAMNALWDSYYRMAGRLFFRMLYYKEEHKGHDTVLERAIPYSAARMVFWDAFTAEAQLHHDTDHDARTFVRCVSQLVERQPDARIGVWGCAGRGQRFVWFAQHLKDNLCWVADRDIALQGTTLERTNLTIARPETLREANLDILILGVRGDFVDEVIRSAIPHLKAQATIVSVLGLCTAAHEPVFQ